MSQVAIDAMDDASRWKAFQADGVTASTEFAMSDDVKQFRYGADKKSGKVSATTAALNHVLRRTLAPANLSNFDNLLFWINSNRPADGSLARPFFLEMRMASANVGLGAPANTWSRLIPISQTETWELVRLGIDNLPANIRGAVNLIQLRCVDASASFTCNLDDVIAVRAQMIDDVDAALLARLHQQLTLNGNKIPAVIDFPGSPAPPNPPYFRIVNYDVRLAREQMRSIPVRGDYSGNGFRLRPSGVPYQLFYEIEAIADTRANQTGLLEFVLASLAPYSHLLVNDVMLPVEVVDLAMDDSMVENRNGRVGLHFQVMTWQEQGAPELAVPPYHSITVDADQRVPTA